MQELQCGSLLPWGDSRANSMWSRNLQSGQRKIWSIRLPVMSGRKGLYKGRPSISRPTLLSWVLLPWRKSRKSTDRICLPRWYLHRSPEPYSCWPVSEMPCHEGLPCRNWRLTAGPIGLWKGLLLPRRHRGPGPVPLPGRFLLQPDESQEFRWVLWVSKNILLSWSVARTNRLVCSRSLLSWW